MALVPKLLKPSRLIRRKAMYSGVLGPSTFWKVVAAVVFGQGAIKKFFGKQTEVLDLASLGANRNMVISTAKPLSRKQRKRLKRDGVTVSLSSERGKARRWAEKVVADKAG